MGWEQDEDDPNCCERVEGDWRMWTAWSGITDSCLWGASWRGFEVAGGAAPIREEAASQAEAAARAGVPFILTDTRWAEGVSHCGMVQCLPMPVDVCAGRWVAGSQPIAPDARCAT